MPNSYARCATFRNSVLCLSIIDIVSELIILGLAICAFYPVLLCRNNVAQNLEYIIAFSCALVAILVQVLLDCGLIYGAKNDRRQLCRIWVIVSTLLVILKLIIVVVHLVTGNQDSISYGLLADSSLKVCLGILVNLFMIHEINDDHEHGALPAKEWTWTELVYQYNKYNVDQL